VAQRDKNQNAKGSGSKKTGTSGAGKGKKRQEAYVEEEVPAFLQAEVMIILSFAAAVLLFLSNFHLCGVVGDLLRGVQLGMFGMIGYVFPFLLFMGTTFYQSNRGNRKAAIKLAAVIAAALTLCGLAQMLFGPALVEGEGVWSFYETASQSGSGGGLIGGLLAFGLKSVVGSIGAYLVFLAVLIICGVCITEKSVVSAVKSGSGQAYQYAKEDAIRRRAERVERQEERRRLREENVVRGVDFGATVIGQGGQPEAGGIDPSADRLSEQVTVKQEPAKGRAKKQAESYGAGPGAGDGPVTGSFQGSGAGPAPDSVQSFGDGSKTGYGQSAGRGAASGSGQASGRGQAAGGGQSSGNGLPQEGFSEPVEIWSAGRETMAKGEGTSSADVFSGRIEYPPEYQEPVPFEEDKPEDRTREKIHSFAKRASKKSGPLYADRETRTLEEMDVLPVPALLEADLSWETAAEHGGIDDQTAGEHGEVYGQAAGEPGEAHGQTAGGHGGAHGQTVGEHGEVYGQAAGEPGGAHGQTAGEPEDVQGQTARGVGGSDSLSVSELSADLEGSGLLPGGSAFAREEAEGLPLPSQKDGMTDGAKAPTEDGMLDEDWADEEFLDEDWTGDVPLGYGQDEDALAGYEQTRYEQAGEERSGYRGADRETPGYDRSGDGPGLFVPEGEKRVVTASGKVIETETQLLQKKLVKKREEALDGTTKEAVYAAVKAPAPPVKKEYIFPPTSLLKRGDRSAGAFSEQAYKETAIKLQQTLRDFGVGVTVTNISCGPSVTRYELHPEQGVKVSKIVGLADDIKLSLAAAEIRIEAPIPGKSAVGIEVPNKETSMVYLRDLLEADSFRNNASKLTFAVGKDIAGQPVMADIAKMPHLLIAGATGSGKSVCINTLIMSIIFKADPEDVKLIMVDPKVVELSVYNGIPHLLIPVVTDPKKASGALNWAVAEMEDRYRRFAEYNVRNLQGYNEKIKKISGLPEGEGPQKMPQIVIIIDELADLMMVVPGEVEDAICRLAQLARAAGIHLVIATQRPSVNVITGLIKANVPSRIAFAVSSGVDSRTIIDMNGAEKLLGKGDMLFFPSGIPKPQRVQGAFISDQEVSQVVDFLTEQGLTAAYDPGVADRVLTTATAGAGGDDSRDEYFAKAGRFIIEKEKASIGMLQRVFKIGFNRAARIMDQLADAGVVGEEEGTKPRRVLMTMEEFEALVGGGGF